MKKIIILGLFLLSLTGCSFSIKEENVVKQWGEKLESLESYKANVNITNKKGNKDKCFTAEVLYLKDNYKVTLKNSENNSVQVLLKNTDGVFVLTPALNKSYRFESQWPGNAYHAYLPLSVYKEVLEDQNASVIKEDCFVVSSQISSRYNQNLASQKVFLDTKTLCIKKVIAYDAQMNVLIEAKYDTFEMTPKLAKESFILNNAMSEASLLLGEGSLGEVFECVDPSFELEGCSLAKKTSDDEVYILEYTGEVSYTIIQRKASVAVAVASTRFYNDIVELDMCVALKTDNSLSWRYLGSEYQIISNDMEIEDMIMLANSINA